MFKKTAFFLILLFLAFPLSSADETKEELLKDIPKEPGKVAELRKEVDVEIDTLSTRMIEMNDFMYENPEPAFLEFQAAEMLAGELEKHGFEVERGVPGLPENFDRLKVIGGFPEDYDGPPGIPTAFKAKYKVGADHPAVGIVVEYDALRGNPPFHGCQHNMQAPVGIGAMVALAKIMKKHNIPGTVYVVGTPAEEVGPPTKANMVKTGYLDGIDFMMRTHGTSRATRRSPGGFTARNIRQMKYTFHGASAHAQRAYQGRSALDAVFHLFHAVDMMREHSQPQFRFHGIVSDGGAAPNIVPQMASATIWVRHLIDTTPVGAVSPSKAREMIEAKVEELDNMAKGAALATGTTVDIDHYGEYVPGISVAALNDISFFYEAEYGGINLGRASVPRFWEETGFATIEIPGCHPGIGLEGIPPAAGHSQAAADITVSDAGHRALIQTARVVAAVNLRLLLDEELRERAKAEHAAWKEKYNQ
jgi:amidohydrolase